MKIPTSVKVMGKKYKIIVSDHIDDCGNTDFTKCTVWINPNIDEQQIKDTVLHELVHAIDHELHLNMDERQVHCMATGLLEMLMNNPRLVKFLNLA